MRMHTWRRHIDEGGHPDDFVRQAFTTAAADQQVLLVLRSWLPPITHLFPCTQPRTNTTPSLRVQLAAGRVAALEELRTQLAARAAKAFPAAAAAYECVACASPRMLLLVSTALASLRLICCSLLSA
jgi:hypothetical protein